jgi:hypothetical protein
MYYGRAKRIVRERRCLRRQESRRFVPGVLAALWRGCCPERTAADFVTTSPLAKSQRFTHYSLRLDNGGMDAVIPLGEFWFSRSFCDRLCGRLGHIDPAWHEPRLHAGAAAGLPA